jgi:hypothetical protein
MQHMHRIMDAYRVDRAEGIPAVILYQFIDPGPSFPGLADYLHSN